MADYNVDDTVKNFFDNTNVSWKLSDKIPLVSKELELLKNEMKTFLIKCNHNIDSILNESIELCIESKSLLDEFQSCREEIENDTMSEILKSIESHDKISKELHCVEFSLDMVSDIIQCGKYVKEFDEGREAQSYTRAVEAVYDLLQFVQDPAEGLDGLDIFNNTKHNAQLILDNFLHDLYSEWDKMVAWSVKPDSQNTVILITLTMDQSLSVIDAFNALDRCKRLGEKVTLFAQFILNEVLIPLIRNNANVVAETDELMTITINHKSNIKPNYCYVISNLRLFFQFISSKLNVEFHNDKTIMKMIGNEICADFKDILVEDCLVRTIPNNMNDLQTYTNITSDIEDFQRFLAIIKFFPSDQYSILEYVDDIDVIFAEKSSQNFLETARNIMMKDLSITMSIGVESIPENSMPTSEMPDISQTEEEAIKILDSTIPKSLFYFPRCMISKTAQEILDLVYNIMEQAVQCSDVVSKKLYNTTRLVFELYDAVVPYHHEHYLQTIPQYVALFHNNCMYLAHNLLTFGDKWSILMEGRELDYPISFVDLVQKLRDLGYKHLTIHMQQQRKQILDNIRSSDLNCIVVRDVLGDNAEAAVRQCLRQLQLLKNVWVGVFPSNVFTRLMCMLVNMFTEELIHRVCTVEDISMEMATQLTDMYSLVVQKAPLLFKNQSDLENHVKCWTKLQELIFVLNGSLKDIENHWKDGTGPLAVHFKTEELRSLIKALFQNTQLRSNLLSKIK